MHELETILLIRFDHIDRAGTISPTEKQRNGSKKKNVRKRKRKKIKSFWRRKIRNEEKFFSSKYTKLGMDRWDGVFPTLVYNRIGVTRSQWLNDIPFMVQHILLFVLGKNSAKITWTREIVSHQHLFRAKIIVRRKLFFVERFSVDRTTQPTNVGFAAIWKSSFCSSFRFTIFFLCFTSSLMRRLSLWIYQVVESVWGCFFSSCRIFSARIFFLSLSFDIRSCSLRFVYLCIYRSSLSSYGTGIGTDEMLSPSRWTNWFWRDRMRYADRQ